MTDGLNNELLVRYSGHGLNNKLNISKNEIFKGSTAHLEERFPSEKIVKTVDICCEH